MNVEESIKQKIINALQSDDESYEVVNSIDNSEIRGINMVAVAIDETTQVNVGLPDYKCIMSLYVSTHITEDAEGELFKETVEKVENILNPFILKEAPLCDIFEEVPVVGFFFDSERKMVVDDIYGKCNLAHLKYTIITSY